MLLLVALGYLLRGPGGGRGFDDRRPISPRRGRKPRPGEASPPSSPGQACENIPSPDERTVSGQVIEQRLQAVERRNELVAINWSLGTFFIVFSFTLSTCVNFTFLLLITLPGAVFTSLANRIRGGPNDHPKRKRKRLTFSAWLSNLIAPLPFLPHRITDLLPVRGAMIPLPVKRWISVAGDASGGRRCIRCLRQALPPGETPTRLPSSV